MEKSRTLTVSIDSLGRGMVYLILALTLFQDILVTFLHLPGAIRMLNDGFLMIAVLCAIAEFVRERSLRQLQAEKATLIAFLVLVVVCACSAIVNQVPVLLALWSARQNLRGIVFLFAAVVFCTREDVERWFRILFWLQIPNAILVTVEYVYYKAHPITHIFQDAIGGLFGNANSSINIYVCIMVTYSLYAFLEGKMSWWKMVLTMLLSTYVATIAEVRIVYIYYVLIFGIMVLFAPNSRRKWGLVGFVAVMFVGAMILCERIYPGKISNYMSPSKMIHYMSNSYGDIDPEQETVLPRIGSFQIIAAQYLDGVRQLLLGIGFGNAENSSFSFLQSEFVRENTMWNPASSFMSQITFLQTGILGIISWMAFLVVIAWNGLRRYLHNGNAWSQAVAMCMAVYSIALIWYDVSIRNDICYLLFWSLAVGAVCAKDAAMPDCGQS